MRDAKTVLMKRLARQSQAAVACCGELAKIAREIARTCAQASEIQGDFTAEDMQFVKEHGRRIAAYRAKLYGVEYKAAKILGVAEGTIRNDVRKITHSNSRTSRAVRSELADASRKARKVICYSPGDRLMSAFQNACL